jgi:hypothetical protein
MASNMVVNVDRVGLGPQTLRPGGSGPSWRRIDSVGLEDLPHEVATGRLSTDELHEQELARYRR